MAKFPAADHFLLCSQVVGDKMNGFSLADVVGNQGLPKSPGGAFLGAAPNSWMV